MTTALAIAAAVLLGALGAWGTYRLLGWLELDRAERFALTLGLFPALLGLAAFAGLVNSRPGALLPSIVCVVLAVAGIPGRARNSTRDNLTPQPQDDLTPQPQDDLTPQPPLRRGEGETEFLLPLSAPERGLGGEVTLATLLFAAGTLGTTLLTPLSAGALRIGDWVAHWFLVLVYLGQPLPELRTFTNRVGDFGIISRPPLYNLEGGLLVGALDVQFWPFQLVTPLLGLSVAATGVLWARAIGGRGAAQIVAPLIGLSPFLLQNASYPWSKMVAAGLVLLFLLMIRAAALAHRPARARQTFVLAACCAGLAFLAHQTSIFYILPTLVWLGWRRPRPLFRRSVSWTLLTWSLGGLAGLIAYGPWQLWVLQMFGLRALLDANPASFGKDVSETFLDWLVKGLVAALGTLVPIPASMALARGTWPSVDQLMRVQLALLTGAIGISGCWLLVRAVLARMRSRASVRPRSTSPSPAHGRRMSAQPIFAPRSGWGVRARRLPWLALVVLCGFLGQVMLQPNWHDTGDAAESMTPIVILALAYVGKAALSLGPGARRLFWGLVLLELACYLALWLPWAFGSAWTRDPNAVLGARYGLDHIRNLWAPATPLGALLLAAGLGASSVLLWRALGQPVWRR